MYTFFENEEYVDINNEAITEFIDNNKNIFSKITIINYDNLPFEFNIGKQSCFGMFEITADKYCNLETLDFYYVYYFYNKPILCMTGNYIDNYTLTYIGLNIYFLIVTKFTHKEALARTIKLLKLFNCKRGI